MRLARAPEAPVNAVADGTLFPGCNSWYLGASAGQDADLHALVGVPPHMKQRGGGSIINTSSIFGLQAGHAAI